MGNLSLGTIPRSIWVVLEEDLVDSCKPGDDITVLGVVTRRWHAMGKYGGHFFLLILPYVRLLLCCFFFFFSMHICIGPTTAERTSAWC